MARHKSELVRRDMYAVHVAVWRAAQMLADHLTGNRDGIRLLRLEPPGIEGFDDLREDTGSSQRLWQVKRQATPLTKKILQGLLRALESLTPTQSGILAIHAPVLVRGVGELRVLAELCDRVRSPSIDVSSLELTVQERKWLGEVGRATSAKRLDERIALLRRLEIKTLGSETNLIEWGRTPLQVLTARPDDLRSHLFATIAQSVDSALDITPTFLVRTVLSVFEYLHPDFARRIEEEGGIDTVARACRMNLRWYWSESQPLMPPPEKLAARVIESDVRHLADQPGVRFIALVGEPGFGKSVAAFRSLGSWLDAGRIGLRLDASSITLGGGLSGAVKQALADSGAARSITGDHLAKKAAESNGRQMIVCDDLSRGDNPIGLVRRVLGWSRADIPAPNSATASLCPVVFIVPVWRKVWVSIESEVARESWCRVVEVGPMSVTEAESACELSGQLTGLGSGAARKRIVGDLANDPLLIGMYRQGLRVSELIDDYATRQAAEALGNTIEASPSEAVQQLESLAGYMVRHKCLSPSLADIDRWFPSPRNLVMRRLVAHGGLICERRDGSGAIAFRHDRLAMAFISRALRKLLDQAGDVSSDLLDPFFSSQVGEALAAAERPDEDRLKHLLRENPVVLATYLERTDDRTAERIVSEWLAEAVGDAQREAKLYGFARALARVDSPTVLRVTLEAARKSTYWPILVARLRNGCATSGINLLLSRTGELDASVSWADRDDAIRLAVEGHLPRLVAETNSILGRKDIHIETANAAIEFAGFVGASELAPAVVDAWHRLAVPDELGPVALWAALRTGGSDPEAYWPVFEWWLNLPDGKAAEDEHHSTPRRRITEQVSRCVHWGFDPNVADWLVTRTKSIPDAQFVVWVLLNGVDTPYLMEHVAKLAGELDERIERTGGFSPWLSHVQDTWNPTRRGGRRVSGPSQVRLQAVWSDEQENPYARRAAFGLWKNSAQPDIHIETLRSITDSSPLYEQALWQRARWGDRSTVPAVTERAKTGRYFIYAIPPVWCDELRAVVSSRLLEDEHSWDLAPMLLQLESSEAESLLTEHWSSIRTNRQFVQAALFVGTDRCHALVRDAIGTSPDPRVLFQYLHFMYTDGFGRNYEPRSLDELERLIPFLPYFGDHTLYDLARVCEKQAWGTWGRRHIKPLLGSAKGGLRHLLPTDDELVEEIVHSPRVRCDVTWFDVSRLAERGIDMDHFFDMAFEKTEDQQPGFDLPLLAEWVSVAGTRNHLDRLMALVARIDAAM